MAITGGCECDFVVWTPKSMMVKTILFDRTLWQNVMHRVGNWFQYLEDLYLSNGSFNMDTNSTCCNTITLWQLTWLDSFCDEDIPAILVEPVLKLPNHLFIVRSLNPIYSNQVTVRVMNVSPSPVKVLKEWSWALWLTPEQNISMVSEGESSVRYKCLLLISYHFPDLLPSEKTKLTNLWMEFHDIFHQVRILVDILLLLNILYLLLGHQFSSQHVMYLKPWRTQSKLKFTTCWSKVLSDLVIAHGHPL